MTEAGRTDQAPSKTNLDKAKRVILVEDDDSLALLVQTFFQKNNVNCVHYSDPNDAIAEITNCPDEIGAVISDLNMPKMSGFELIKMIRRSAHQVPVIMITVSDDIATALRAIDLGAFDFVVKPLPLQQLLISTQRAFRSQQVSGDPKLDADSPNERMIARSPAIRRTLDLVHSVACCHSTVLLTGESGAGKELFAKTIHSLSPRRDGPFVAINCSTIPENLLESELFGHARGAFTGATEKKIGLFEAAIGGSLFLDEIGDLDQHLQAKLLRVLQEQTIRRVGENQSRKIDVRVIAATHKNLQLDIAERRFREDLYFRLSVFPIHIPPLRERAEDIIPLAELFLKRFNGINGKHIEGFSEPAKEHLLANEWRGNVRELENTIERSVILCQGRQIDVNLLNAFDQFKLRSLETTEAQTTSVEAGVTSAAATKGALDAGNRIFFDVDTQLQPLEEIERRYVHYVFEKSNRVRDLTARILQIDRKTLSRKLRTAEDAGANVL